MSTTNNNQILTPEMSLSEIQNYMQVMAEQRGFSPSSTATMLILLEEVGELAKALRKHTGLKIDHARLSSYGNLSHEMADVLICLMMLANKCNVNLCEALAEKETINRQRTWSAETTTKDMP
jgi:NTP pyrophosphatase (non-canonical NTP hydrolase)